MNSNTLPALLGGKPIFDDRIPIIRPTLPHISALSGDLEAIFSSGIITNSTFVEKFEKAVAEYLGVKQAVALSSCTSGLILSLKALDLSGEVLVPSYTFSATGHAALWNGLKVKFVDIDPETFNVDPNELDKSIGPETSAILVVHAFGNPCEVEELEEIASKHDLRLVFDAASALGSLWHNKKIGNFGDAEVFSLSPTKIVTASEGGIVATNNDEIARRVRIGRDYGNPGNYDCEFNGISARMEEFNAVIGLKSLEMVESNIVRRYSLVQLYKSLLKETPGISFQNIRSDYRTTYKDFAILVETEYFGMTRDMLATALDAENITTRKYFYPPLHKQQAYAREWDDRAKLPVTNSISHKVLCLPIFSHMSEENVKRISEAVHRIHLNRIAIRKKLEY